MPADLDELARRFPGSFTTSSFRDNDRVVLSADQSAAVLLDLLRCLKHDCGFDFLADIAGIDYLNYPNASERYGIVYALTNTTTGERVFVKAFTNDPDPQLPSVASIWQGANWMEREVYDMFGVSFTDHPDLRRILMPSEFTSHPLRKDYPLRGLGERHNFPTITRAEG